jgi:phosphoglucomutase
MLCITTVTCCLPRRYFGKEAAQIIVKLAAGNGFKKIYVGKDAIMATPAMSAFIRRRKAYGERVLRAVLSNNP